MENSVDHILIAPQDGHWLVMRRIAGNWISDRPMGKRGGSFRTIAEPAVTGFFRAVDAQRTNEAERIVDLTITNWPLAVAMLLIVEDEDELARALRGSWIEAVVPIGLEHRPELWTTLTRWQFGVVEGDKDRRFVGHASCDEQLAALEGFEATVHHRARLYRPTWAACRILPTVFQQPQPKAVLDALHEHPKHCQCLTCKQARKDARRERYLADIEALKARSAVPTAE